jgi:multiple sugar transport system substrate-binding protein
MAVWLRLAACMVALAWAGAAGAQQVTLRMWMHEHPPRIPIDKQIVAEFEKANPDIKVDHEIIPVAEYPTKLLTAFAAGSGPDIFNQSSMLVAHTTHTSLRP